MALWALLLLLLPACRPMKTFGFAPRMLYHQEQLWTTPKEYGAKPSVLGYETQPAPWPLAGQTVNCDAMTTNQLNGECISARCPRCACAR